MEQREHLGRGRLVALGGALLMVATFLVIWSASPTQRAFAEPHPGINFNMAVPGYSGCNTNNGDAQCYIQPGTTFTVNITLGPLPSDVAGYQGYDIELDYSGLTSLNNASTQGLWPDCAFPAASYDTPGVVQMGCAIGIDAPDSTYTGLVGTEGFTCSQSGAITMKHGNGATDLLQNLSTVLSEPGASETLNITCGSPSTPTVPTTPAPTTPNATQRAIAATATPLPGLVSTGSGGGQGAGDLSVAWLLVGTLVAVSGVTLMGWKFARSR